MRKKLLALLMCATMVLGSSVVASADAADDYKTAQTIVDRSTGIVSEIEDSDLKAIEASRFVNGVGMVYYGFTSTGEDGDSYWVRLTASGASTYYEELAEANLNKAKKDDLILNGSVAAADVTKLVNAWAEDAFAKNSNYVSSNVTIKEINVLYTQADVGSNTTIHAYMYTIPVGTAMTGKASADSINGTTTRIATSNVLEADTTKTATGYLGALKKDADYITGDGYGYDVKTASLLKAIKTVSEDTDASSFAYILKTLDKKNAAYVNPIAYAVENGQLTKNAAAVGITVYQYGFKNDKPYLKTVQLGSVPFTLTVKNDLLSRAGLKTSVDVYGISDVYVTSADFGSVKKLVSVASGLDVSTAYSTFTLPVSYVDNLGVLVFDQSAETSNNDGVSTDNTTAAPAADKTTSYTTGDVAPIAALAIVMMGAFGAMVVASKKRV